MADKLTTEERKALFLKKYEYYGTVWPACRAAGIKRRATPYDWCKSDEAFAEEFREIQARVEDELASRLMLGARSKLKLDANQLRASIFTLKALNPDRYAEKHQLAGKGGGPITVEHNVKDKLISMFDSIAAKGKKTRGSPGA